MYHRNYQLLTLPSILLHRGLSYRNASTYRCIVTPLVVLQSLFCMSVKQPMSANRPMSLDGRTSGNGPKMRLLSVNQPMLLNLPLIPDLIKGRSRLPLLECTCESVPVLQAAVFTILTKNHADCHGKNKYDTHPAQGKWKAIIPSILRTRRHSSANYMIRLRTLLVYTLTSYGFSLFCRSVAEFVCFCMTNCPYALLI